MFALICVILLFADKGSGTGTPESSSSVSSNSSAEVRNTTATYATSANVSATAQETKAYSSSPSGVGPRILNTSKCERQAEVLTCTCISEGFPLPTIKWPCLENHTKYCVTTNVSSSTVTSTSTITVSLKHFHNTTIECVSSNSIGTTNRNITTKSQEKNLLDELLKTVQEPKVYIAALTGFVIGIVLSPIVLCLVKKSCRKKHKTSENLSENLEMVTTGAVPMMDADQAAVYDGIHEPEAVEGEAQSDGQSAPDGDLAQKDVEYSDINFSAIKTRNPEEAEKRQDTTDTEYAEIKREKKRQENSQEDSEMLEGNEEKELITGEDNDAKKAEEEGGEDVALYSSVDEIMG